MQTLGLASEQKPTDGLFKRLLWPTIENAYDVDLVSQQGFWLCVILAAISTVTLLVAGHVMYALLIGLTYYLAGVGVRERSLPAAILILCCYLLDRVAAFLITPYGFGGGNPVVGVVAVMLLVANIRATVLARKWRKGSSTDDRTEFPDQVNESWKDRFVNTWPSAVWPRGQFVFYPLASGLLLLTLIGMMFIAKRQRLVTTRPAPMEIQVRPQ